MKSAHPGEYCPNFQRRYLTGIRNKQMCMQRNCFNGYQIHQRAHEEGDECKYLGVLEADDVK